MQPLFCRNEVSSGTRHKKFETVPRQCVNEVDPKLQEPSSFKLWALHKTWTEDTSLIVYVWELLVVRKICWKMVPQSRHILNLSCGSAAHCATVLRIVKVRLGHTTRPVIQVVPGHTIAYVRIWRFQDVELKVDTAVKPGKKTIYFEHALLVERTALGRRGSTTPVGSHFKRNDCPLLSLLDGSRVPQGRVLHADNLPTTATTSQTGVWQHHLSADLRHDAVDETCETFCGSHSGVQLPHFDVTSGHFINKDGAEGHDSDALATSASVKTNWDLFDPASHGPRATSSPEEDRGFTL